MCFPVFSGTRETIQYLPWGCHDSYSKSKMKQYIRSTGLFSVFVITTYHQTPGYLQAQWWSIITYVSQSFTKFESDCYISDCSPIQIYMLKPITNSLWLSDAIWWQRSGSTLMQVMAGCLTVPSLMLINHKWDLMEFNWDQFHRKCSLIWVWKLLI